MSNFYKHPTAIVSEKARIGDNVTIGPFTVIEDDVEIGDNTEIRSHCFFANGARIGKDCRIFTAVSVATEPQDLKFKGEPTLAIIGDRTMLREYANISRGTLATGSTVVGDDCMLMAYSHVAHDCKLGNNIIVSNVVQFAGHVTVEDWVILGGVAKVHQFSHIGAHSFVGADVKVVKDVAPYTLIGREPPKVEGLNIIGLRRRGFTKELIEEIQEFYKLVLYSGYNNKDGIAKYLETGNNPPEIQHCIEFIQNSERGIYR